MTEHEFYYIPHLIGARKRYTISLRDGVRPRVFKTMTTDMRAWSGEVLAIERDLAQLCVIAHGQRHKVSGIIVEPVVVGGPAIANEHLRVDLVPEYLVSYRNFLVGDDNFVNYGTPDHYLRVDIYTGQSRIIRTWQVEQ